MLLACLPCLSQEDANRRANQDRLGQLGLMPLLVALSIPGAPSAAVRAQVSGSEVSQRNWQLPDQSQPKP